MDEFRTAPLSDLYESPLNTRRHFDSAALTDLTASVRQKGVLVPLLVRENERRGGQSLEILAGARRYRAAKAAEIDNVPVRVCVFTDDEALEVVVIENLQREDVHPLEEAQGYRQLLERPGGAYEVPAIAGKVGKSESYVYQRLKLLELIEPAKKAFLEDELTAGHAILIARLQPRDQAEAMKACSEQYWDGGKNAKRTVSVRELARWIEREVHLDLQSAAFNKLDDTLLPSAGACTTCPKRSGFSPALFPDLAKKDVCTDRACFKQKLGAHIDRTKAALEEKGEEIVKLSTEWSDQGGKKDKEVLTSQKWNEVKRGKGSCEATQKGIIVEGRDVGKVMTVCTAPRCKTHSAYGGFSSDDGKWREKQRRAQEQAKRAAQLRRRIFLAVFEVAPKKLGREELVRLAVSFIDEIQSDVRTLACEAFQIPVPKQKHSYGGDYRDRAAALRKWVRELADPELARFLVMAPLLQDLSGHTYHEGSKGQLKVAAAQYGVKVAKIEKAVADELKEKAKKRRARETAKKSKDPKKRAAAVKEEAADPVDVDEEAVSSLTGTPAHDVNFKSDLKRANRATLVAAIKMLDGDKGSASRAKAITGKLRKLAKQNPPDTWVCEVCACMEDSPCPHGCAWESTFLKQGRFVCTTPACVEAAGKTLQPSALAS